MSFIGYSDNNSVLSNKRTPQKKYQKNTSFFGNNINKQKNLFTSKNQIKKAKNIFTTNSNRFQNNGIFSFPNNQSNNINTCYNNASNRIMLGNLENKNKEEIIPKNIIFNNFNDCTIGKIFNGKNIKVNNEKIKFMNIHFLPEFSHGSNEEFRMADLEMKKTGNIIYYKVKNTSGKNNIFGTNTNNLNSNTNNIFFKSNENNQNSKWINNNSDNIFNKKLESKLFDFSSKQEKTSTLFTSNITDNTLNNNILFGNKKEKYNSPFSNYGNNNSTNNYNLKTQNNNKFLSFVNNNGNSNCFDSNINSQQKGLNSLLTDEDAYNLFSPNGKLSKEINEAIQDGKTVKDFLEDLRKKYPNMEKFNSNNNNIIQNDSEILDLYGSFLSNNSNGISSFQKDKQYDNFSPIKIRNSLNDLNDMNDIKCFNMEIEDEFNFDKLASKINEIYNGNNSNYISKINNNDSPKFKNNFFNKNKNNISNKEIRYDNENYFNKTFSNGFYNSKSLLNNDSFSNVNNLFDNKKNVLLGRDEYLYQQNLQALNKLSISNINLKEVENDNEESNQIFPINNNNNFFNNKDNITNGNNLKYSANSKQNQNIDLMIKYHLPDEEKKNNKYIEYYNLFIRNINASMKVKDLKEKIKLEILEKLKMNNIMNYSIEKISLLYPLEFLLDNKKLLDYQLERYNYTIQAFITYRKNQNQIKEIKKNIELTPLELIPKLSKPGYKCFPSIVDLCRKSCEELRVIKNFKILNEFGEVEFKEPINLLGINLDNEITIEENMIETGDKLNYWSIFKLYNFRMNEKEIIIYINQLEKSGGKFISYKNNVLIWEYKGKNGSLE